MIGDHLLPHRVRPVPSVLRTDAYGNAARVPGAPGAEVPAYVQPDATSEDNADGQVREQRHRVFGGVELAELDAWSGLEWEGRTYGLVGDPRRHDTPAGAHHVELTIRRVGA